MNEQDHRLTSSPGPGAWFLPDYYDGNPPLRANDLDGKPDRHGFPIDGENIGLAFIGLKRELVYNGYAGGIIVDSTVLGDAYDKQAKLFQAANGLVPDGQVGPKTARALFHKRVLVEQTAKLIPDDLLCKLLGLESGYDPAAIGRVDNLDRGLAQIHLPAHPDVTLEQALDPAFSIPWTARSLKASQANLGDWDGAAAAHNVGNFYAAKWVQAGKPATGGTILKDGRDVFAICTNYVQIVKAQPC